MTILYGIKNCDTVRKARRWLDAHGVSYTFHDLREDGLSAADVQRWIKAVGSDSLLNRRSTTWRQLSAREQAADSDEDVFALLCKYPTLVKRPILEHSKHFRVGFRPADYDALLAAKARR